MTASAGAIAASCSEVAAMKAAFEKGILARIETRGYPGRSGPAAGYSSGAESVSGIYLNCRVGAPPPFNGIGFRRDVTNIYRSIEKTLPVFFELCGGP